MAAVDVARTVGADERGTRILLDALEAFGYLRKTTGRYENTAMAAKWLVSGSPARFRDYVTQWERLLFPFWDEHLEESVRHGRPAFTYYEWVGTQPEGWRMTQDGFGALARWLAPLIAAKVKLPPNARRLIDVGGGHGLYAVEFCRRHPQLSATIFDAPEALGVARERIASEKMQDRISVQEGDFRTDDFGSAYDVALLFNILHGHSPDENVRLPRRVAAALAPSGQALVLEQLRDPKAPPFVRAVTRFFALNYLATLGGQTYSLEEISHWFRSTGFSAPRIAGPRGIPVVVATKAG